MNKFTAFQKRAIILSLGILSAVAAASIDGDARIVALALAAYCVGWVQRRPEDRGT